MATIKDIARAAGVSHATVSNVLNQRGNVSAQKIRLVMDTAEAMGYRINEAASALRSGGTRTLFVVMPDMTNGAHADLYHALSQAAAEHGCGILLRLTDNVPANEHRAIRDMIASRAKSAVIVTSLPDPAAAYAPLLAEGVRLVFALRGAPEGLCGADFDMESAARDIAGRVLEDGARSVALMTGLSIYPAEERFRSAFLAAMAAKDIPVRCVQSISSQYCKQAFALLDGGAPDAVVATSEQMGQAALHAADFLGASPRVYTLSPARILPDTRCDFYAFDYRKLGMQIASALLAEGNQNMPEALRGVMPGFVRRTAPAVLHPAELTLLSAETPAAQALARLSPRLKKDTGISLSVTMLPTREVSHAFMQPAVCGCFDMARMDLSLMSRLGSRLFLPLEETPLDADEILPRLLPGAAEEYARSGGSLCALPFDPSCHLLFFREDLFSDPRSGREFYETFRTPLRVPQTHEEFLCTARFFDGAGKKSVPARRGAILTRRSSEYVSALLSLSGNGCFPHLTGEAMRGFIQGRQALEHASAIVTDGRWNSAVSRFARGESALLIAQGNYAGILADEPLSRVFGRVGFALAPGGRPMLGGGALGLMKTSRRTEEAAVLLRWLYSREIGALSALLCGCSPLSSALENEEALDIYPWMTTAAEGIARGVRRSIFPQNDPDFDLPGAEMAVALQCERAMRGEISPEKAAEAINALGLYK